MGSIADVPTTTLEALLAALEDDDLRAPVNRERLMGRCASSQLDPLVATLGGHSKPACAAILRSVLEERARHNRCAPELVWTGPEGAQAQARDTAVVLRELFKSAQKRVILAGYSFKEADSVLSPLHEVMVGRGVEAHFFVDIPQPDHALQDEEAWGRTQLQKFLETNWKFGTTPPKLYCDRRALRPGKGKTYYSLHAKCVSVDGQRAFVSSANFTQRGQDRNIETGVLLDDPRFARQLEQQWMSLVAGGFVLGL